MSDNDMRRILQLKAALSAIRDIAEQGRNEDKTGRLEVIKKICDEQIAWQTIEGEED